MFLFILFQILILIGGFCLIMGLYETFEYLICYNEEKKEHAKERRLILQAIKGINSSNNNETGEVVDGLQEGNYVLSASANSGQTLELSDNEDEYDIFNASETSRLLNPSGQSNSGTGSDRGVLLEAIPLSTFRVAYSDKDYSDPAEIASDTGIPIPSSVSEVVSDTVTQPDVVTVHEGR